MCPSLNRPLKKGLFLLIIIVSIVTFLILTNDSDIKKEDEDFNAVIAKDATDQDDQDVVIGDKQSNLAIVDVKGEIKKPGIYEVDVNARVNDVIQMAGGFTKKADESIVNLAQKVQDEMVIQVPAKGVDSGHLADASQKTKESNKIKINEATQEEIESLSGIGPAKAQAIIQHREENGFFQTTEDLLEVSGIGEKTLENLQDELQIP